MNKLAFEEIPELANNYFKQRLANLCEIPEYAFTPNSGIDVDQEIEYMQDIALQFKQDAISRVPSKLTRYEIDDLFEILKKDKPDQDTDLSRELVHYISRANVEVMRIVVAMLSGNFNETEVTDPLFRSLNETLSNKTALELIELQDAVTLKEAGEKYVAQKDNVGSKAIAGSKVAISWMADWFPQDVPVDAISQKLARSYRDALEDVPVSFSKKPGFKGLNFKQAVEKARLLNKPYERFHPATAEKHFRAAKQLFGWCVSRGYIATNPFDGLEIKVPQQISKSGSDKKWSDEELTKILQAPIFTGYKSVQKWKEPGKIKRRRHEFWYLLVVMLSGMRRKEAVMLQRRDIMQKGQINYFNVTCDLKEGKTVKTKAGIRKVPIHPILLELGFLDYVKKQTKGIANRFIFKELISNTHEDKGDAVGKKITALMKSIGVHKKGNSLHAFRHSFIDALRAVKGVDPHVIKQLVGHEKDGSVTDEYGEGYPLDVLHEPLSKTYGSFDFKHLHQMN